MNIIVRKLKYRFRRPKKKRNNSRSCQIFFAASLLIAVLCSGAYYCFCSIEKRIAPAVQQSALSKLSSIVTMIANNSAAEILGEKNAAEEFVVISRDDNGRISSVTADGAKINALKSKLAVKIQAEVDCIQSVEAEVPSGILFSDSVLTGAGINLKLKVFTVSSVIVEFKDNFVSAGINQTKYSVYAVVKIPVRVIGIGVCADSEISVDVPISETIVIGDIPQAFFDTDK